MHHEPVCATRVGILILSLTSSSLTPLCLSPNTFFSYLLEFNSHFLSSWSYNLLVFLSFFLSSFLFPFFLPSSSLYTALAGSRGRVIARLLPVSIPLFPSAIRRRFNGSWPKSELSGSRKRMWCCFWPQNICHIKSSYQDSKLLISWFFYH